jgi:cytochrome c-type biogenesis protein
VTPEARADSGPLPLRLHLALHTLAFVAGLSAVFVALGFSAGLLSHLLFAYGNVLRVVAGVLLVVMGVIMLDVLPLPMFKQELRLHLMNKPSGYLGSAVVGVAFAAGWTPCIGPILAGILGIAATSGGGAQGGLLLLFYSLGFSLPFLALSQLLPLTRGLRRYSGVLEKVGAVLLIAVGVLLLTGALNALSPYLANMGSAESALFGTMAAPTLALAFGAGALSFLSPCVLPILPSFLAYLSGMNLAPLLEPRKP